MSYRLFSDFFDKIANLVVKSDVLAEGLSEFEILLNPCKTMSQQTARIVCF